jgi:inosine-uridine nucleoside N-ribohydrolase
MSSPPRLLLLALALLAAASPLAAQPVRQPVLFDADLGNDVDDALALALLLASPEVDVRGVSSVGAEPDKRALFACRFLTMTGRRQIPVAAGLSPKDAPKMAGQYQYYYHPDVLFNRTTRPVKEGVVDFIASRVGGNPRRLTILATGPLTNVAKFLDEKPDGAADVLRIIVAGGNLKSDVKAAKVVLDSGVPLVVIPVEVTAKLKLKEADRKRIFAPATALSLQTEALYQLSDEDEPNLADVLAASICIDDRFCEYEERHVTLDDKGALQTGKGKANAKVVTKVKADDFLKWYVDRMASCVKPSSRPAKPVERGGFPNRVHVAEDYDTDIERRWWMAGKAETKNLPSKDSKRACRGVLTHDFDDLLGNAKAMWTAVVFNPVPGPPMGKNTRLNFNVWLSGTSELRVQIYSLTNGYHRHLVLKDLPQKKWQNLTVDMTQARRPDGTGGPLSEGERIDDIQFYAEPTAELIIDDIFLYDAAVEGEKRPFPKKVHFTAWFDSGKQGKEWPGKFEIALNKGYFWHAAKAVPDEERKTMAMIRLDLRGPRPLRDKTMLTFRYRVTGADSIHVTLRDSKAKLSLPVAAEVKQKGKWAEMTVDFLKYTMKQADELFFRVPRTAELLIDDVLLYEPGE